MKYGIYLFAGMLLCSAAGKASAQLYGYPFYAPPGFGYRSGIHFHYHSGRLSIHGFINRGYGGYYYGSPIVPVVPYPVGVVQTRVNYNIYPSPTIIVAPVRTYDTTGVDLDLVRPDPVNGFQRVAAAKFEPEPPAAPKKKFQLPGKNVSVPKAAVRPPEGNNLKVQPKMNFEPKNLEFPPPPAPPANPRKHSNQLIALGLDHCKAKEFGLAAQRFKKACIADPSNFLAFMLLGQAEFAFGRYNPAVQSIFEAMNLNPDYPGVKFQPRTSLYKGMEPVFEKQLDRLELARKQNPKSANILFLLAHQYWFDARRDEALDLFREARPLFADPTYIDRFLSFGKPKAVAAK